MLRCRTWSPLLAARLRWALRRSPRTSSSSHPPLGNDDAKAALGRAGGLQGHPWRVRANLAVPPPGNRRPSGIVALRRERLDQRQPGARLVGAEVPALLRHVHVAALSDPQ